MKLDFLVCENILGEVGCKVCGLVRFCSTYSSIEYYRIRINQMNYFDILLEYIKLLFW
jgi:hypothetical protein